MRAIDACLGHDGKLRKEEFAEDAGYAPSLHEKAQAIRDRVAKHDLTWPEDAPDLMEFFDLR